MNITIKDFPDEFPVTSNGGHVVVKLGELPEHIVRNLLAYGVGQFYQDKAASALSEIGFARDTKHTMTEADFQALSAKAAEMMAEAYARTVAGEWSVRRKGVEADPLTRYVHGVIRDFFAHPAWAKQKATYKAFKGDDAATRRAEYLDKLFDGLDDARKARVTKLAKDRLDKDAAKKAQADKLAAEMAG